MTSGFHARDDLALAHWDETDFSISFHVKLEQKSIIEYAKQRLTISSFLEFFFQHFGNIFPEVNHYIHWTFRLEKVTIHYMSRFMKKPTKWPLYPEKTQISLGIRPVWSESSLSAWRNIGSSATHWAHCEDSRQTGQMPRLIRVYAGLTDHFVGFIMKWLISLWP